MLLRPKRGPRHRLSGVFWFHGPCGHTQCTRTAQVLGNRGALCRDGELQKAHVPSQCSPRSWGVCLLCRLCILAREPHPPDLRVLLPPEAPGEEKGSGDGRGMAGLTERHPRGGAGGSHAGGCPASRAERGWGSRPALPSPPAVSQQVLHPPLSPDGAPALQPRPPVSNPPPRPGDTEV